MRLSVSIVTYDPDIVLLDETLRSLRNAVEVARRAGSLADARIDLVDNGPGNDPAPYLEVSARQFECQFISGHGNVGYGRGHNISLLSSAADFHLVLNPDVIVNEDAIDEAIRFMVEHPRVVILAPQVLGGKSIPKHLCKRYPTIAGLALRGFAPAWLKRFFDARMAFYEMRDLPLDRSTLKVPVLSGSFMFCRRVPIAALGGFSDAFFVYFEDFDLSLRASRCGELAFVPQVKVTHYGGNAARKGWRHIALFVHGALVFFRRHGWRWW